MVCWFAAYSMQVLQQRALLGDISGADDNVDLGALLAGLQKSITRKDALALATKSTLLAAKKAYDSMILSFQRDNELYDVRTCCCLDGFPAAAHVTVSCLVNE
jgi:hypothetical protein